METFATSRDSAQIIRKRQTTFETIIESKMYRSEAHQSNSEPKKMESDKIGKSSNRKPKSNSLTAILREKYFMPIDGDETKQRCYLCKTTLSCTNKQNLTAHMKNVSKIIFSK